MNQNNKESNSAVASNGFSNVASTALPHEDGFYEGLVKAYKEIVDDYERICEDRMKAIAYWKTEAMKARSKLLA